MTSSNSVVAVDETDAKIGVVFETATPFDTSRLIDERASWYQCSSRQQEMHLLLSGIPT